MTAYYNENDPFCAEWLRNLIRAGHIAPGEVDERSIEDVRPDDVMGFTQCHWFAGLGAWSYALRLAGWPDDRPVWTGSCPCPPFSAAGKGSECPSCGGKSCLSHPLITAGWICLDCGDEWRGDDRHLLPEFLRLIGQCGPASVLGEQVASRDGVLWLYTVRTLLEACGNAFGAADLPAAGVGAPHIRQRLWFVAKRLEHAAGDGRIERRAEPGGRGVEPRRGADWLADAGSERRDGQRIRLQPGRPEQAGAETARHGETGRLADADQQESGGRGVQRPGQGDGAGDGAARERPAGLRSTGRPGPVNGFWRDADWLYCRDDKWRPVEPGLEPLADGVAGRVGKLRAYGNAINAQAARAFIEAVMEA